MLCHMLPEYIQHVRDNPQSLLCRFMGLYELTMNESEPQLFLVMLNTTKFSQPVSRAYDLKGSTRHREAKGEKVGKDMDFLADIGRFGLPAKLSAELAQAHASDVDFLRRFGIMDFSLLVQVHDRKGKLGVLDSGDHVDAVKLSPTQVSTSTPWFEH